MTHRERTLAAMRGEPTDRIPWAPRMDLWYIANQARGTLPDRFLGMDGVAIARELGVACHATGGDRAKSANVQDRSLRCLGLDNHPDKPFRVVLDDLQVDQQTDAENEWTTVHTAAGDLTAHLHYSTDMRRNGISGPFPMQPPIRSPADFEPLAQVFDHLRVEASADGYHDYQQRVGEQGLAIARGPMSASPLHMVLHELSRSEQFFFLYEDARDALYELAERMTPYFETVLECVAACDAEAVMWGANYDQDLTWPPFFEQEISPWLQKVADRLHAAGKLLVTHCDGENDALMELIRDSGADVAESVCPQPMTKQDLRQIRSRWSPNVAVYGGIPSVALLQASYDDASYAAYMDRLFAELGTGERLVLGVADMVPAEADLRRLEDIGRRVEEFGPVSPAGG